MPWYLSNGLLILGKMVNTNESWKNDLTVSPIWGRVMGVPTDFLTEKNTMRLASMAGTVISIQNSDVSKMVTNGFFRFQIRDGFHEGIRGSRKELQKDNKEQPSISLPNQGLRVSNSFTPLVEEMEMGKSCSSEKLMIHNIVNDVREDSKKNGNIGAPKLIEGNGQMGELEINEAQHKGKRRMVETQTVMGYGKLQKTDSPSNGSLGTQQLFDVPITFPKEVDGFKGGSSFVFGSSQQNLSKEQRRKVAVKKDTKNRNSKIDNIPQLFEAHPASKAELEEFKRIVANKISHETNEYLTTPFTKEDVYDAMRNIHPQKALGSDGMPLLNVEGYWNKEKIHAYFHNEDIPWILGTPMDTQEEDVLIWPFSPNGHYLVKSGYRVARELNLHPTRCSNMDQINTWWKMWWHLQLPPRIKLFGWKLCHNWLPAK
ncbi:hypothetical protein G4B88_007000 [Cannabis sativa]|uniref:Reverse transcriptase zinc-binding domain-containing protein n=1 Tax=Cannabis sativa TaxID=3483 RepID=A0A7J6FNG6_CANSA|nr:hypothetical protein G4B88_007000 [Cannabis sativa]